MENTMKDKLQRYHSLTYPTFKRIGCQISTDHLQEEVFDAPTISGQQELVDANGAIHILKHIDYSISNNKYSQVVDQYSSADSNLEKYRLEAELFGHGVHIEVPKNYNNQQPLIIEYTINKNNVINNSFTLADNANLTVILKYNSTETPTEARYFNGLTRCHIGQNARLQIVVVQSLNNVNYIHQTAAVVQDYGKVAYNSFHFGGQVVLENFGAHLVGNEASVDNQSAYVGNKGRILDIQYDSIHYGRNSQSLIDVKGALLDQSKKVFRGNLKFHKGAVKAQGEESEYVLLLNEGVHSDAIPALLCDEDDVVGEHAASAGQVDANKMFYLMSRGMEETEAKKLVIQGSFSSVIDRVPDLLKDEIERQIELSLRKEP